MNKHRAVRVAVCRRKLLGQAPGATVDLLSARVVIRDVDRSRRSSGSDDQLVQAACHVHRGEAPRSYASVRPAWGHFAHLIGNERGAARHDIGQRHPQDTSQRKQVQAGNTGARSVCQRCHAAIVGLRDCTSNGLVAGHHHVAAGQSGSTSSQGQRCPDVVAEQFERGRCPVCAVDVLLSPRVAVTQRATADDSVSNSSGVLQPVDRFDLVHRCGGRNRDGRVLEVFVTQALGHEQATVGGGHVRVGVNDHQVLDDVGRTRRNGTRAAAKGQASSAANRADGIPSCDLRWVGATEADARTHALRREVGPGAGNGGAADTHSASGVVLQDYTQAACGDVAGGWERQRDGADQVISVGRGNPRPQLNSASDCGSCKVRAKHPEQVVCDLDRVNEVRWDG